MKKLVSLLMVGGALLIPGPAHAGVSATLTTQATALVTLGQPISDTATVTGPAGAPVPTGTVTFTLFGPGNPTCTGTPIFTSAGVSLNASGVAASGAFTPTVVGTYNWVATYSGDVNYPSVPSACDDPLETSTVNPVTAVALRSLAAIRLANGVLVRWSTAAETQMLGFHVYRQVNGKRARVTRTLIAAKGRGGYSFLDRKAPQGKSVRYWLQAVNLDGSRNWYGPARVLRT